MKRLRYKEIESGVLKSTTEVLANAELLTVTITIDALTFTITNRSGMVFATGTGTNLNDTKRLAKSSLKKLGVQFLDEVRNKKEIVDTNQEAV